MNQPSLVPTDNGLWRLTDTWHAKLPDGRYIAVPRGVKTNFASIPWFGRWLVSAVDPTLAEPAIVHDYLVGEFTDQTGWQPLIHNPDGSVEDSDIDWRQAAAILRWMMEDRGAKRWKRQAVYWAVRVAGWFR